MTALPLKLGPLAPHSVIRRSGVRWLCEDGYVCRRNEVIAYCNISVERSGSVRLGAAPFADEAELQIGFAPRIPGRLRIAAGSAPGGFLELMGGVHHWDPDAVLAHLEPVDEDDEPADADAETLRLVMLAGRRMSGLVDVHSGMLPGWHNRAREWWWDRPGELSTLLSLGICDATGVVRGDRAAFLEMFEAATRPAQVVFVPDHPIAPCAPVLVEQFTRTQADYQAIASEVMRALTDTRRTPTPDDLMFAGALLSALERSPMRESYELLTSAGFCKQRPADAILLSLNAEAPSLLRHKKLGFHLHILHHHQAAAGPVMREWLGSSFERVKRTVDDIRRDYRQLFDTVSGARFLILNRMSTSGQEDLSSYTAFDPPMSETLANIASKELNLMLHDLAAERDFSIIDVDAIAAELGGAQHLPDGIHQSGAMQAVLRSEILHILESQPVR